MASFARFALWGNVLLGLMFAFIGVGVYATRVDYGSKGTYGKGTEQLKALTGVRDRALPSYYAGQKTQAELESTVPKLNEFYTQRVDSLRTGADNNPVRALVLENGALKKVNGFPQLGRVMIGEGAAAKEIAGLEPLVREEKTYSDLLDKIKKTREDIASLVDQQKKLSSEIGDGSDNGLRSQLAKILDQKRRALEEQEFLKPLLYNAKEEMRSLAGRGKFLDQRAHEIHGGGAPGN